MTTNDEGDGSFTLTLPEAIPLGRYLTATATDAAGNTSEFTAAAEVLEPSAAPVSISGRVVSATGRGIGGAVMALTSKNGIVVTARTSTFGYFRFDELEAGRTYILTVEARLYSFARPSAIVTATDSVTDIAFIADP